MAVSSAKIFSAADKRAVGFRDFGIDAAAAAGAFARLRADGLFLGGEPRERRFGVGGQPLLALDVGGELHEPQLEFGDAVLGARFLAIEVLRGDVEAMQRGAGARLGLAQLGQRRRGMRLARGGFRLRAGALGDLAHADVLGVLGVGHLVARGGPAQVIERGLGLAHLRRHGAIADRLARLLLQRVDLGGELADHVLDAAADCFRRPSAAVRPRAGGHAGRQCRRLPPARGGAARAWPG